MEEAGRTPSPTTPPRSPVSPRLAASESWAEIPETVLIRVSSFLSCRADRLHMACVNRHWYATVTGLRLGQSPPRVLPVRAPLPPELPWLIFPSTEAPTFYSAVGRHYHRLCGLPPDVRRARFCGSAAGGWLVLALNSRHEYVLYNLNSGERFPLPPAFKAATGTVFPLVVRAATLAGTSVRNHPMVAAIVLVAERFTFAFWNEGRERWFSPGGLLSVTPQDVIFHGGGFFFITSNEDVILLWERETPDGDVTVARVDYAMQRRGDYENDVGFLRGMGMMRRYLVESRGHLLMVVRYIYDETGTEMFRIFDLHVTADITNAEPPRATWEDLGDELDGRMLFLGPGCSRSFEVAHYDGFQDQEAMVFFLDESFESVPSGDGRRLYSFTDMGRYSMEEMTVKRWPPESCRTSFDNAPPTWWFH